jgi:hypothetical protein
MMLGRIRREEDEPRDTAGNVTSIRHGHAEDARIEVFHSGEVETAQPKVAERELPAFDVSMLGGHSALLSAANYSAV